MGIALDKLQPANVGAAAGKLPAEPEEAGFTIGSLAREFGLTLRTLRFYESRGFLSPRRLGPLRLYRQADHDRLAHILTARKLGFTLREIQSLIAEQEKSQNGKGLHLSRQQCTEQINLLERRKRQIENALDELRRAYSRQYRHELAPGDLVE